VIVIKEHPRLFCIRRGDVSTRHSLWSQISVKQLFVGLSNDVRLVFLLPSFSFKLVVDSSSNTIAVIGYKSGSKVICLTEQCGVG